MDVLQDRARMKLPEDNQRVLASVIKNGEVMQIVAEYYNGSWWEVSLVSNWLMPNKVVGWTPLPIEVTYE